MTFSDSDATRIISALDERFSRRLGNNAMITSTWGEVVDVDAYGKTCSVLLYGEDDNQYKSQGFRIPEAMVVTPGYNVKVSMNGATGERWVDEASIPSVYKKVAIDPVGGTILTGDGSSAPVVPVGGGSGRNLLPNGGFLHGKNGWSLYQNGDTTATFSIYSESDSSWTLRDGEVRGWDGIGGPYGSTAYIYSTATGTYEPYINSQSIPVLAGQKYSCRALIGQHRTSGAYMSFWFYDNTGAFIGGGGTSTPVKADGTDGGAFLSGWDSLEIIGHTAPAGAQSMVVAIVMKTPYTSSSDCYLFIDRVMLTQSASAQDYQQFVEPGPPVGAVTMFAGSSSVIPDGWLVCNGAAVSRSTYNALYSVIGTTYGVGDGSTTFNLPSMAGKFPVCVNGADTSWDTLGETGGAKTHTHAGHSNHSVTQPSDHPAMSHSAHSGTAVGNHAALAGHVHELPFMIDDTYAISSVDTGVFGTGTSRTRDWTSSVTNVSGSIPVAKSQSVSGGTPDAHSVTQPSAHSDHAAFSHSGTAVDAHSAHDSPSSVPPYFALNFIIKF